MAKGKADNKKLLERVRSRYKVMQDFDRTNRSNAIDDLRFLNIPGEQWDPIVRKVRGDRACYEFNKIRVTVKRIINDIRANRPQGKVRAVEDNDKSTAEILEGLTRNIWTVSDGDTVIDAAAEFQVGAGMGAWRIATRYADESAFDQDIVIEPIRNPFCLYADPAAQDFLKRDAQDWILTEKISRKTYEMRYPKAEVIDFESSEFDEDTEWDEEDRVRIAEYWWKEPYNKTILLLSNGATVDGATVTPQGIEAAGLQIVKTREAVCHRIKQIIVSGEAILEGPNDWPGSMFPFVQVYGEYVIINGEHHWFGLTRFAKDAQRSYNVARTAISETIAAAPQAKYWATPTQALGHEIEWAEAHQKLFPYMLYNPDMQSPGPPVRMAGADVPAALMRESELASEEIKAVTGIYDASLGNRSNETSGIAIRSRQQQGEISTFNYSDNMAKGVRRTWEILIDLIPKVYDSQRSIRILGADGSDKYTKVNVVDPMTGEVINDLSRGKFDVTVTTGPSYATQRMEAAQVYAELGQTNPQLFQVAGDLIMKASDLPYSEQIAERLKTLLPPQIQQMEQDGKPMPPEVVQAMAQAEQAMQQVQAQAQALQEASKTVMADKQAADKAKADVKIEIANLRVQEAQIETKMANFQKLVAETQAKMSAEQKDVESESERESLSADLQKAVADIQTQANEFAQQAIQVIAEIQKNAPVPTVIVPPKPKIVRIDSQRVNGKLVAIPVYEDEIAPQPVA
jgi:hypothetical protein